MHVLNDWRVLTQLYMCSIADRRREEGCRRQGRGLRIEAISFSTMAARWCDLYDESACGDFITFAMRATLGAVGNNPPPPSAPLPAKHFYSPPQAGEMTEVYFNRSICHDLRPLIDCPIDKLSRLACKLA